MGRPAPLARWLRVVCGLLAALMLAAAAVTWTATDYLWFRKLGFAEVFRVSYGVWWAMFGVTGGFMALVTTIIVGLNLFSHIGLEDSIIQNPRGDDEVLRIVSLVGLRR